MLEFRDTSHCSQTPHLGFLILDIEFLFLFFFVNRVIYFILFFFHPYDVAFLLFNMLMWIFSMQIKYFFTYFVSQCHL